MKKIAALFAAAGLTLGLFACSATPPESGEGEALEANEEAIRLSPCSRVRCASGTHCEVKKGRAKCVPDAAECTTDADCRVEADYCTGCDCRPLASRESLPVCTGPGVRCFADPCMNKTAICSAGQCVVSAVTQ